jgi:hypothetical protein
LSEVEILDDRLLDFSNYNGEDFISDVRSENGLLSSEKEANEDIKEVRKEEMDF